MGTGLLGQVTIVRRVGLPFVVVGLFAWPVGPQSA